MSDLSKRQAADLTMQILQEGTRKFIDIPDEHINYAAAAGLYVNRTWPTDDVYTALQSANASGPEMASAIRAYTNLCSKTVKVRFTRQGTWNLTADGNIANQGQDYLNQQSALPVPGTSAQYIGYRYIDNGATGNGTITATVDSFQKVSGNANWSKGGTRVNMNIEIGSHQQVSSVFTFNVENPAALSRFHITYARFDDFTAAIFNGVIARVYNGDVMSRGQQAQATKIELINGGNSVDLGAIGIFNAGSYVEVYAASLNDDMRPYLKRGQNTLEYVHINGPVASHSSLDFDIVEQAAGPTFDPRELEPDAPGYDAVVRGDASLSRLTNLLTNLQGKLYNYTQNHPYSINYCHTNCHNNCHSSRGRR